MEINFEYCLIDLISFIDISTQLSNIVPINCYEIQSFDVSITSIILPNWSCNDNNNYTIFDFSRFSLLESIEIGDNSFGSVSTFQIDGLNRLKTIKIGKNSFTQRKNSNGNDASKSFHILNCESLESIQIKSFHILNCESLESIQIGEYSFSDFAGEFELKNLTQLQSIQIGIIGSNSNNFYYSSFEIGGIYLILNVVMNRSSIITIHHIR